MKRFVIKTLTLSLPIIVGIGYFYYSFWNKKGELRDLSRLGMFLVDFNYQYCIDTLSINFIHEIEYDTIIHFDSCCIITIGDSFSQQGVAGYQNYLSIYMPNIDIGNLQQTSISPEQMFIQIALTNKCPKIVVIESVERYFIDRLNNLQFTELNESSIKKVTSNSVEKTFLGWTREFYKKRLNIDNPVSKAQLSHSMFSCKDNEKTLYFINGGESGTDIHQHSKEEIKIAQLKLDSLYAFALQYGIELYYMVAVDKYDLYQDYIINNSYPRQETLDKFDQKFHNNPYWINTKHILKPYIEQGELDMYYCDDTHWSTKSAKVIAEEIAKRIYSDHSN